MQNQYRDPPPYPGHSKQLHNQPGLRQSFSGSETSTDVSVSSSENLTTLQRQEPQGEENVSQTSCLYSQLDVGAGDSNYSILTRLGMPPMSSVEHKPTPTAVPAYFVTGPSQSKVYAVSSETGYSAAQLPGPQWASQVVPGCQPSLPPPVSSRTVDYSHGGIPHYRSVPTYVNSQWSVGTATEPGQNNQVLSYIANLPPPPEYPGNTALSNATDKLDTKLSSSENVDKIGLTKSQPDLRHMVEPPSSKFPNPVYTSESMFAHPIMRHYHSGSDPRTEEFDQAAMAARTTQMIEMLSEENRALREELNVYYKKVSKLQKFELEIQKVHDAYESLVKSSQKRERLELTMKKRMEEEINKLKTKNNQLREQVDGKSSSSSPKELLSSAAERWSNQLEKETTIGKLKSQNSELLSVRDRLERDVESLRYGLQEQKDKVDILDNALTNAQANVVRLEEECNKKQAHIDKIDQVQKAFVSLQSVSERREHLEKQVRVKLEKELESLRTQQKSGWTKGSEQDDTDNVSVSTLKHRLDEKDAKVLALEAEVARLEQKCLEESTMRQLAMDESASPKEFRLAALEKTSADTEKLINEAKSEKLKHMEELYQSHRKIAELEARVKSLQTQLAQTEGIVKVFQHSPMTRSSSVHTIYCSPLHSPRPSIMAASSLSHQTSLSDTTSYKDYSSVKHVKSGSASAVDIRKMEDELREKFKDLQTESKDDSDDETRLWQV
ncbi:angiomotin-like isoform X2 [Gigantopelta aegis]|nr:angiomotin-like isoform X2 [Gigantopelta aegis]XP_041358567.1 angiomotin-like isoform X2 [Gigantopelta aegis]XP_041358574.1 angiomotin-like isoform X2 [Gigantopelta aegis]XP_041358577.1 angiomotin-like isoform X2 [Gigantopelta aegis]